MTIEESRKTVLVTGGAGFIGSHVVDALVATGSRVLVVDDLSSGKRENVHPEAEMLVMDIRSDEAAQVVESEGIGTIFHLAAQMDVRRSTADPRFDAEVNILGLLNLLQAAVRGRVGQVVFSSTGGAIYGEQECFPATEDHPTRPLSPYGVSKLAGERYLYYFHEEHGLDVSCLRYANVYGERQNPHGEAGVVAIFMNQLLNGQPCRINGHGLQTRDYVYVSDVVAANLAVLGRSGFQTFNVGTGRETSVVDLYRLIAESFPGAPEHNKGPAMPGEQMRSSVDASALRETLGWAQPLGLAPGIARTAAWFKERNMAPAGSR